MKWIILCRKVFGSHHYFGPKLYQKYLCFQNNFKISFCHTNTFLFHFAAKWKKKHSKQLNSWWKNAWISRQKLIFCWFIFPIFNGNPILPTKSNAIPNISARNNQKWIEIKSFLLFSLAFFPRSLFLSISVTRSNKIIHCIFVYVFSV